MVRITKSWSGSTQPVAVINSSTETPPPEPAPLPPPLIAPSASVIDLPKVHVEENHADEDPLPLVQQPPRPLKPPRKSRIIKQEGIGDKLSINPMVLSGGALLFGLLLLMGNRPQKASSGLQGF